jgi:hypothetical protein
MRRSGYIDLKNKPMFYKKWLCKKCGKTITRIAKPGFDRSASHPEMSVTPEMTVQKNTLNAARL